MRGKFKELLGKYGESDIPIKEMIEKLMRDTVKADESMLPHICALDWECDQSSIFTDTETKMVYLSGFAVSLQKNSQTLMLLVLVFYLFISLTSSISNV